MEAEAGIGLVVSAEDGGEHGGGHGGLEDEDALEGDGHGEVSSDEEDEGWEQGEAREEGDGQARELRAALRALTEKIDEGAAGEEEGQRDGRQTEHVHGFAEEEGHPLLGVDEVEKAGGRNGQNREVDEVFPERSALSVGEDGDRQRPHGQFDAQIVEEEHAEGFAIVEGFNQGDDEVAVVLHARADDAGAEGVRGET